MPRPRLCPAPVRLEHDPRCGRYIVADRDIGRGETVLAARPYAVAITSLGVCGLCLVETSIEEAAASHREAPTASSNKVPVATRATPACAGCGVTYCSAACHDKHAEFHVASGQCRVQQLVAAASLRTKLETNDFDTTCLLAAILARAHRGGEIADDATPESAEVAAASSSSSAEERAASDEAKLQALANLDTVLALSRVTPGAAGSPFEAIEPTLQDVLSLVSNVDGMGPRDVKRFQHCFIEYERLRALDARLPEPGTATPPATRTLPRVSERLWTRLCGIDQCNSFGFWHRHPSVSHFCRAVASAPGAALFNHSCDPNIVRVNSGSSPVFVAMRNISAGTPVCISYVGTAQDVAERGAALRAAYKFDCACARCVAEHKAAAVAHEHAHADHAPHDWSELVDEDAARQHMHAFFTARNLTCGSCRNGFLLPADSAVFKALVHHYPPVSGPAKLTKEAKLRWKQVAAATGCAPGSVTKLRCSRCFGTAALQN